MSAVSAPFTSFPPTMPTQSPVLTLRSRPRTVPFGASPIQDGFAPGALAGPELGLPDGPAASVVPSDPCAAAHRASGTRIRPLAVSAASAMLRRPGERRGALCVACREPPEDWARPPTRGGRVGGRGTPSGSGGAAWTPVP